MQPAPRFEPLPGARHAAEMIDGVEWIVARAPRNWFVLLFLGFWLTMWTFGGLAAMAAAARGADDAGFLLVWLVLWAVGWLFAASSIGWQLGGRTLVGVHGGALVYRWAMPFVGRTRHYDAAQIRHLRASGPGWPLGFGAAMRNPYPPYFNTGAGSVQFDYGARTVRVMPGLDEAEGRMVAEWLSRRLPRGAAAE